LFLKIFIIAGLVKFLLATNKPGLCAALYTAFSFLLSLFLMHVGFPILLLRAVISFGFAYLYFRLLDRFEDSGWFWFILVLGLAIGLV